MTEPSSEAVPISRAPATALEPFSTDTGPVAMDTDAAPVAQAHDSGAERDRVEPEHAEPDKAQEAEHNPDLDKQAAVQLPVSNLERLDLHNVDLLVLCLILMHDQLVLTCFGNGEPPPCFLLAILQGHDGAQYMNSNRCLHHVATLVITHRHLAQPFQQAFVRAAWGMYCIYRTVNVHVSVQESARCWLSLPCRCRLDIGAVASSLPPEAFEPISGSETRQHQWQLLLASAMRPQVGTLCALPPSPPLPQCSTHHQCITHVCTGIRGGLVCTHCTVVREHCDIVCTAKPPCYFLQK